MVTQFGGEFNKGVMSLLLLLLLLLFKLTFLALLVFVLDDFRSRFELALSWLYAEYCIEEGLVATPSRNSQYESCLIGLMKGAHDKLDTRDR